MKTSFRSSCFVLVCVLLAAVASRVKTLDAQQPTDYRVGAQDVLNVTVFGEADLSRKYPVEQDGTFAFPLVGRIKVGGLTLREIEQELKKQLSNGYLRNPQVSITVDTYRSQRILVLGEVRSPGEYQLTGDTTVLSALARAGSTTPAASHEVIVMRPPPHSPGEPAAGGERVESEVIHIDLAQLQNGNLALNITLQDGDTISVPKAQSVFVTGQVKMPGAYAVERGTTVLQVLSLAGGVSDRGADGRIRIQRTVKGKRAEIKAKLNDAVEPGDTIVVPERFF